ncbi:hypothetical protein [Streptomyces paromomycinus]|uniref:hypothetical protein n=1 Tax=Streptomyces paromomycinus TaxID=92743 RepID=UPI00340F15FC
MAVSLGSHRAKGDWGATYAYATNWVAGQLRWQLAADRAEAKALRGIVKSCPSALVRYTPAPVDQQRSSPSPAPRWRAQCTPRAGCRRGGC